MYGESGTYEFDWWNNLNKVKKIEKWIEEFVREKSDWIIEEIR